MRHGEIAYLRARITRAAAIGPCYRLVFAKSRESEMASLRTADPRRNVCLLGKIGSDRYRVEVTRMTHRRHRRLSLSRRSAWHSSE
jgi:hypothetical protein